MTHQNTHPLSAYLTSKNISAAKFAAEVGYKHPASLYRVMRGIQPNYKMALRIEKATKGKVKVKDLILSVE
ncbi:helix-turn-helix domain-containing protein [Dyadobacter bucti]|uniref:helix-turn-helix domain-containing protein n=1 Tax=Dyadobacter bucti TaxID=2572203 RepID=UPI00110911A2|nr:helix-turn-helix domain-containing protein [Dyadobacter bucti]